MLLTDQQSASFMFNKNNKCKIKKDKIYRRGPELSSYSFDIVYRKGMHSIAADIFSCMYSSAMNLSTDSSLHNSLYHPGVTRRTAFVRSRNLLFPLMT